MPFDLYELGDAKIYRDKFDRLWMGPLMPTVGDGPAYYMDLKNRTKVHEPPVFVDAKPVPVDDAVADTETAGVCAVCNTPLTAAQIKRGGKYCSPTCRNKAAKERAGK